MDTTAVLAAHDALDVQQLASGKHRTRKPAQLRVVFGRKIEDGGGLAYQFTLFPAKYFGEPGVAMQHLAAARKQNADRRVFQNGLVFQQCLLHGIGGRSRRVVICHV